MSSLRKKVTLHVLTVPLIFSCFPSGKQAPVKPLPSFDRQARESSDHPVDSDEEGGSSLRAAVFVLVDHNDGPPLTVDYDSEEVLTSGNAVEDSPPPPPPLPKKKTHHGRNRMCMFFNCTTAIQ